AQNYKQCSADKSYVRNGDLQKKTTPLSLKSLATALISLRAKARFCRMHQPHKPKLFTPRNSDT
ncbi:hypothetical protein OAF37_04430, partial [Rubripirellula sp.]